MRIILLYNSILNTLRYNFVTMSPENFTSPSLSSRLVATKVSEVSVGGVLVGRTTVDLPRIVADGGGEWSTSSTSGESGTTARRIEVEGGLFDSMIECAVVESSGGTRRREGRVPFV